ncbi:MAG: hypothetical protein IPK97_07330 [Ahniella sp.]|nr:hypothetical protein [Ahniella sp.]
MRSSLKAISIAQLPIFDLAAALEGAVVDLDLPTTGVPSQSFAGVVECVHRGGGEQHPFGRRPPGLKTAQSRTGGFDFETLGVMSPQRAERSSAPRVTSWRPVENLRDWMPASG